MTAAPELFEALELLLGAVIVAIEGREIAALDLGIISRAQEALAKARVQGNESK
jgi:hypothetical protein